MEGWTPTGNSHVQIATDATVRLRDASLAARSVTLGGGRQQVTIQADAQLLVHENLTLGEPVAGDQVIPQGAVTRLMAPTDSSVDALWTAPDFDDRDWPLAQTPVGYERSTGFESLIQGDVESLMYNRASGLYMRQEFQVPDPAALDYLALQMQYEDGFVAYLNGEQIASANAPPRPAWNSTAATSRPDDRAPDPTVFDVSNALDLLRPGANVLAIHGLNARSRSSDFLQNPVLTGGALENVVNVDGGELHVLGDLRLAISAGAQSRIEVNDGRLLVDGRVRAGEGHAEIILSGGEFLLGEQAPAAAKISLGTSPAGVLRLRGGKLRNVQTIDGSLYLEQGTFAPEQAVPDGAANATLHVERDMKMLDAASLSLRVVAQEAPMNDRSVDLDIGGSVHFAGQLRIDSSTNDRLESYGLAPGESARFPLLTAGSTEGTFQTVYLDELPWTDGHQRSGRFGELLYGPSALELSLWQAVAGDANGDGRFDSVDLLSVFKTGEYEDNLIQNSDWTEGDWNLDQEFSSDDLLMAFRVGAFEQPVASQALAVPEPQLVPLPAALLLLWRRRRSAPIQAGRSAL